MKNTVDKRHYRRLLTVIQKSNGRTFEDIAKEHGVSTRTVQRWISAYLQTGTKGLEIRKPGGTKSRITDENREIILSILFNDPNIFGYIRKSEVTGKMSYRRTRYSNQFQTPSEDTKRYGY